MCFALFRFALAWYPSVGRSVGQSVGQSAGQSSLGGTRFVVLSSNELQPCFQWEMSNAWKQLFGRRELSTVTPLPPVNEPS